MLGFAPTSNKTMYPDRATFERMVNDEPDLSFAAKETLLVLYDGPLKIRQILSRIHSLSEPRPENREKDHHLSESALRKRLDQLIDRGILARAASERTNPYISSAVPGSLTVILVSGAGTTRPENSSISRYFLVKLLAELPNQSSLE